VTVVGGLGFRFKFSLSTVCVTVTVDRDSVTAATLAQADSDATGARASDKPEPGADSDVAKTRAWNRSHEPRAWLPSPTSVPVTVMCACDGGRDEKRILIFNLSRYKRRLDALVAANRL
jgi:hypothetical protein